MSTETPKPPTAYDDLNPEQKARLKRISSEIAFDKLTVSFSIEDRDASGRKKSAFYSVTASRGTGAEINTMAMETERNPASFSSEDVGIARALLCKHVVKATFDDAIRRRIIGGQEAAEECRGIVASYDRHIINLLAGKNGTGEAK